jgi:protein SCO1/2
MLAFTQNKKTLLFLVLLGFGLAFGVYQDHNVKPSLISLKSGTAFSSPKALPEFKLTDQNNKVFTRSNFLKQWSLVFFGYSNCPTICPRTILLMKKLKNSQKRPILNQLQLVMVTADPEHDTVEQLKNYFNNVDPSFIGLTGPYPEIYSLAKGLGLFISASPDKTSPDLPHIPHSGSILMINPKGELAAIFTSPEEGPALVDDLEQLIQG